jgi:hypothetical protein
LKIVVAVVAGAVAMGIPVVLLNSWLRSQGDDEVSLTTQWAMEAAERQIGQAVALLSSLASRGVEKCDPLHLEMAREVVFASGLIKEVALLDADARPLCDESGRKSGRRDVLSTIATPQSDVVLDVVRVTDLGDRFLRVRKVGQGGKPTCPHPRCFLGPRCKAGVRWRSPSCLSPTGPSSAMSGLLPRPNTIRAAGSCSGQALRNTE